MTALSHLQFAVCKLCAECSDAFCCDGVAFRLVLGHLVFQGDEADGGALLFLQAEELQDALVVVHVAIDENEQDLDRGDRRGQYLILDFRMSRLVGLGGIVMPVHTNYFIWLKGEVHRVVFRQFTYPTLESLCGFLKLVHFVLEV